MLTDQYRFRRNRTAPLPRRLRLDAAGHSATGTHHGRNQDRFLVDTQRGLFLVADGMNGMRGGERAAQMAVDLLPLHPTLLNCESLDNQSVRGQLSQAFLDVNQEIVLAAERDPTLYGMGTTAVLGLLANDCFHIASLGDSRAYLLRGGDLHQYTIDHNLAQTLVTMGAITRDEAGNHRWRHRLWKHLGASNLKDGPDVVAFRVEHGDRVVLVSDGVTEVLNSQALINVLDSHATPAAAAESLVRAAVASGTRDDATSVVVNVLDAPLGQ
ncbi:MAG: serine/threonine-protein phosphatase [Planctomycetes bacterium]|nr:serine/threonine-protein phosphatase [Planctomycetota bacterium]